MRATVTRGSGRAVMWILALVTLVPFYFIISTALRTGSDYTAHPGGLPSAPTVSNFSQLFSAGDFPRWLLNSLFLTSVSTILVLIVSVMAAHALTYLELPGAGVVLKLIASLMILPPILLVVPLFVQFAQFELTNSYLGAILIYSGLALPFSIFMLSRFFASIPRSVIDAARVDGAGPLRVLPTVVVPLARPSIITLALLTALFVWNDLLIALIFLQSENHRPLMAGLATFSGRQVENTPLVMSGVLLSILPIVLLYLFSQRFIVDNLYAGSLRGE